MRESPANSFHFIELHIYRIQEEFHRAAAIRMQGNSNADEIGDNSVCIVFKECVEAALLWATALQFELFVRARAPPRVQRQKGTTV
jgi:hypothetical protein